MYLALRAFCTAKKSDKELKQNNVAFLSSVHRNGKMKQLEFPRKSRERRLTG